MTSKTYPTMELEEKFHREGARIVIGVDEAGRGPLAGPVTAAAVWLDRKDIPQGLQDSKKLSAKRREEIFREIIVRAHIGIAHQSAQAIDRTDIRKATLNAMRMAVLALRQPANMILIDGRDIPQNLPAPARAIVKGDQLSASIAAASIVAKVARDHMMAQLDRLYPNYGFARHAGYGTKLHLENLKLHGASPAHRKSFAPVAKVITI